MNKTELNKQYKLLNENKIKPNDFLFYLKNYFPEYITPNNNLKDSIQILKNKNLIVEEKKINANINKDEKTYLQKYPQNKGIIKYRDIKLSNSQKGKMSKEEEELYSYLYPMNTLIDIDEAIPTLNKKANNPDGLCRDKNIKKNKYGSLEPVKADKVELYKKYLKEKISNTLKKKL